MNGLRGTTTRVMTWAFLLGGLSTVAMAQPVNVQDQQQWLLEQVRIGEALYQEDLVRDSLARLWLIAPNVTRWHGSG